MMLGLHNESTPQDAEPDLPDMLSEGMGLRCDSLAAQELMQRRSSWLAGAQQQASELLQHLEGILQFEYARYERHHLQKASLAFFLSVLSLPPSLPFFVLLHCRSRQVGQSGPTLQCSLLAQRGL